MFFLGVPAFVVAMGDGCDGLRVGGVASGVEVPWGVTGGASGG
jgi:hypothetical protein